MAQRVYANTRYAPRRKAKQGRRSYALLYLAAVLAVTLLILRAKVFVVRHVTVEGARRYSAEQVASLAGLSYGESMLTFDQVRVEQSLSAVNDLEFVSLTKQWPSTITLTVRERQQAACVACGGAYQIIDESGYILARSESYPGGGLLLVSGMNAYLDRQARHITTDQSLQVSTMGTIITTLKALGMDGMVSELNLRDLDNIYLVSTTGVQVILGDSDALQDKLTWMRAVLQQLTAQGITRGVLDVSTGKNAVYADR